MILAPFSPAWSDEFAELQSVYTTTLNDLILRVEHVGSTSVPDLMAKPILDIDIVMPDYAVFPRIIEGLEKLGYTHQGDLGIRHREAFKAANSTVPHTTPCREWLPHHLYVCPVDSTELRRHLAFRDALRAHADWRQAYEKLKQSIATRSCGDGRTYAQIKEVECRDFVEQLLSTASKGPPPTP